MTLAAFRSDSSRGLVESRDDEAFHDDLDIHLGPFALKPISSDDGSFLGIGEVLYKDKALRSPQLHWTFYTESEEGVRFDRFGPLEIKRKGDQVTLLFSSEGQWLPRIQSADSMGDARVRTRRVEAPLAHFEWTFSLIREQIWQDEWEGLAMTLAVRAPSHPIHWVIEDTTWEIGGEAAGCTLIQQDLSSIDLEQTVTAEGAFSTIERFFTEGGWGGSFPMDMLPRAAGAAICDFQVKEDLALCLFAERPSLTRARIEKFDNENVIHYTDRPFFALTEYAVTPKRKLLVRQNQSSFKRHEWRNLWLDCFTEVRRRILGHYDFQPEIPRPLVHAHLWDDDLKKLGSSWTEALHQALPELSRLGYTGLFTHGVWESITSDPNPPEKGNICCPYEYKFADSFGGEAGMRQLAEEARSLGIEVFQWFGFHLSRHAPVWQRHPDWIMREANGDPWDGAYQSIWSGRYRSDFGPWMKDQVKTICEHAGLTAIFWDSYQNLGITCVDWAAADRSPQVDEIWRFQAELQHAGISQRCEVTTIFGISQVAIYGFESDKFRRRLWSDTERNDDIFVLIDSSPCFFSEAYPFTQETISPERYFWMLGHRVVPLLPANPWREILVTKDDVPSLPGGALAEEYARTNRLYEEALPRMKRLRLSEGGAYALWLDERGEPSVIWAFRDSQIAYRGKAQELGSRRSIFSEKCLMLEKGDVWSLESGEIKKYD